MFKLLKNVSVKARDLGLNIFVTIRLPQIHSVSLKKVKQDDGSTIETEVHSYESDPAVSCEDMLQTCIQYWGREKTHDLLTSRFIKVVAMDRLRMAIKEFVASFIQDQKDDPNVKVIHQPTIDEITKFAQDFLDQEDGWNKTLVHPSTPSELKKSAKKAEASKKVLQDMGVDLKSKTVSMEAILASMQAMGVTVKQ